MAHICDGAGDRRTRTLSDHQYPEINFAHHAPTADPAYVDAINRARQVMTTYLDMEELIRLAAYRSGSVAKWKAVAIHKPLEAFLAQSKVEATTMAEGYQRLDRILRGEETQN